MSFQFDRSELQPLAAKWQAGWATTLPFPHVVLDDVFPTAVLDAVLAEYPEPEDANWQQFDRPAEVKLAIADTTEMGPATRHFLAELNGQVFAEFLETLTGIEGIVPDPHLVGGGLHQIRRGGFLKVHADFNRHKRLKLDRRLNALIYLNKDWPDSYGGQLEFWDRDMTACVKKVAPLYNRMVIFATTDFANHGHPDPLECPPERARRSLALYYYSNGRPPEEVRGDHTTLFKARPGESYDDGRTKRDALRRWIPPALLDLAKRR